MGWLGVLGKSMQDGGEGDFWTSLFLAGAMTFGFQNAIDDDNWYQGSDEANTVAESLKDDIFALEDDYQALTQSYEDTKEGLEQRLETLDAEKKVDELKSGKWAYNSDKTRDYMWTTHVLKGDLSAEFDKYKVAKASLVGEVKGMLYSNEDISEQQYEALAELAENRLPMDMSNYGQMLQECQWDKYIVEDEKRISEIESCMRWENTKDVADWVIVVPAMILAGFMTFPLGAGLRMVDNAVEKQRSKPKKKDLKPN